MKTKILIPVIILLITSCKNIAEENSSNGLVINDTTAYEDHDIAYNRAEQISYTIDSIDTVSVNGYTLIFQPSEKITLPLNIDQKLRDSLSQVFSNSHEKAIAMENIKKEKHANIFSSNDSIISIRLTNGNIINFPKVGGVDDPSFNFDSYIEEIDHVLLHAQYYEGSAYLLLNRKTGYKEYLIGRPIFNKNNTQFVATHFDLEAGYNTNGIELFTITEDSLKMEFEIEIDNWGAENAIWKSDSTVIFESIQLSPNEENWYKYSFTKMTIAK